MRFYRWCRRPPRTTRGVAMNMHMGIRSFECDGRTGLRRTWGTWMTLIIVAVVSASPMRLAASPEAERNPDPGWAIILAADYQGKDGNIYAAVQKDAVLAYKTLVQKAGLRPDRIILLAEGDEDIVPLTRRGVPGSDQADVLHVLGTDQLLQNRL